MRILLFGAGGHARVAVDALEAAGTPAEAIYDDDPGARGTSALGCPVLGGREDLFARAGEDVLVVIAIARNDIRSRLAGEFGAKGLRLGGFRHPAAVVSRHARVAATAQLLAGAIVNPAATVMDHAIVNTGAVVEHDCRVGRFVHLGPGSTLAGRVEVGDGAFLGAGSCVIPFVKVGAWAVVGAGAAVTSEVPEGATVAGVPARPIRGGDAR